MKTALIIAIAIAMAAPAYAGKFKTQRNGEVSTAAPNGYWAQKIGGKAMTDWRKERGRIGKNKKR